MTMRLISDDEVAAVLTMRDAVAAMAAAFEQFGNGAGAVVPRMRATAEHRQQSVAIATMGAALPAAGVVGAKVYTTIAVMYFVVLFAASTLMRVVEHGLTRSD